MLPRDIYETAPPEYVQQPMPVPTEPTAKGHSNDCVTNRTASTSRTHDVMTAASYPSRFDIV